ncbi:transketolase [Amycolatopsis sp. GM8]|uniref:transketolase family protein n=1 Tax=Amycolatopsis sp. GM8 TaxID=2896530 RepID=UPI0027E1A7DC|nr:transketolase [Amycolatopsis sp. GM8]
MRATFLSTMDEALAADPRLVLVLADIPAESVAHARRRYPGRVLDVGNREQALIGVAGGLALAGLRPVAHALAPFLVERPYEQIKLDLTHQGVGAVLVSSGASYDLPGRTHQSPADVALLDTVPGWTVHVPGHPGEARRLLLESLPGDSAVYVRLSDQTNARPHLGAGFQLLREGRRGVVLAVGPVLDRVLAATGDLDVTLLYANTIRPFDAKGLRAAIGDVADVVLVEPYLAGTSAHQVAQALADVPHRLRSLGVRRDAEVRVYGNPADHDAVHGLDLPSLQAAISDFCGN